MSWSWYGWIWLVSMVLGGLFALSEIIKQKNAKAGESIEKIAAYQGYVGLGLVVFSLWNLFLLLGSIGSLFAAIPVSGVILIIALLAGLLLGLMESIDVLASWKILKEEMLNSIKSKLLMLKVPLGIVSICTALYLILFGIIHWGF